MICIFLKYVKIKNRKNKNGCSMFNLYEKYKKQDELIKAIKSNDVMRINQLLNDSKSDPTINDNEALILAVKKDLLGVIDILLKNWDVLSTVDWSKVMGAATNMSTKNYIGRIKAQRDVQLNINRL